MNTQNIHCQLPDLEPAVLAFITLCLVLKIPHDLPELLRTQLIKLSPDRIVVQILDQAKIRLIGHHIQTAAHFQIAQYLQIGCIIKKCIVFVRI